MPIPVSEKIIQSQIMTLLTIKGYFCWRQNSGAFQRDNHFYVMTIKGAPDIIGITPSGQFFGIEVKTRLGKQNPNQIEFQRQCELNNGLYILARSVEDVVKGLFTSRK